MFPRSRRTPAPARVALLRTLEALECRATPAGLTHTTTSTLVDEVVTNTPVTVELANTQVIVPDGFLAGLDRPQFLRVIPASYDPANPQIAAAIADAMAAYPGYLPSLITPIRRLTASNYTPLETGRSDTAIGSGSTDTVGPATIYVGDNQSVPYFVPAGTVNTNTLTQIRRDIATKTVETYTTTQDYILSPPRIIIGGTAFTTSTTTVTTINPTVARLSNEIAATRIVGTFDGVRYDTTLAIAYDPANPDIQAAIAAARQSLIAAGAKSAGRVTTGQPERFRSASTRTTLDSTTSAVPVVTSTTYIGPAGLFYGDNQAFDGAVYQGSTDIDLLTTNSDTINRVATTTDTFVTTTTIEVSADGSVTILRAVGADIGGGSRVRAVTPDGAVALDTYAYETTFTGGVRVATGDVTGDGVDDVLTAPGDGGGPRVRILDGATGATVRDFFAFADTLRVGAFVAAADVNGDGFADYAVTAGLGGGSRVALFDGKTGARLRDDFLAFDAESRTGFTVALGAVLPGGKMGVAVGQLGGGSGVRVFDLNGTLVSAFAAYESFAGGVYLSVGDADGNGTSEVITGAGPGGGPRVRAFDVTAGQPPTEVRNAFTFDMETRNGVRVGTGTGASSEALLVAGLGGVTRTAVAGQPSAGDEFAPFGPTWTGGVWLS